MFEFHSMNTLCIPKYKKSHEDEFGSKCSKLSKEKLSHNKFFPVFSSYVFRMLFTCMSNEDDLPMKTLLSADTLGKGFTLHETNTMFLVLSDKINKISNEFGMEVDFSSKKSSILQLKQMTFFLSMTHQFCFYCC